MTLACTGIRVCHFEGRFSAFWWQHAGAFLFRLLHGLLARPPEASSSRSLLCFSAPSLHQSHGKRPNSRTKSIGADGRCVSAITLFTQVEQTAPTVRGAEPGPQSARALEQCLGLVIWATSISKHPKPVAPPVCVCDGAGSNSFANWCQSQAMRVNLQILLSTCNDPWAHCGCAKTVWSLTRTAGHVRIIHFSPSRLKHNRRSTSRKLMVQKRLQRSAGLTNSLISPRFREHGAEGLRAVFSHMPKEQRNGSIHPGKKAITRRVHWALRL